MQLLSILRLDAAVALIIIMYRATLRPGFLYLEGKCDLYGMSTYVAIV